MVRDGLTENEQTAIQRSSMRAQDVLLSEVVKDKLMLWNATLVLGRPSSEASFKIVPFALHPVFYQMIQKMQKNRVIRENDFFGQGQWYYSRKRTDH